MTADTFLDDGPAKDATGEVRGNGVPVPVTAAVARVVADQALDRGASTCVLLTDTAGHLTRLLRIGRAPENGWTRTALLEVTRRALQQQPEPRHHTDAYTPTVEIADFVAARDPVCTFPGCSVPTSRCDLDHTIPHPRGPTSVQNLSPRSRRCHRYKTAALWHCRTLTTSTGTVIAHEWTAPSAPARSSRSNPCPADAESSLRRAVADRRRCGAPRCPARGSSAGRARRHCLLGCLACGLPCRGLRGGRLSAARAARRLTRRRLTCGA